MKFADFKDRLKTNHPSAEVSEEAGAIVVRAFAHECRVKPHDQGHDVLILKSGEDDGTLVWGETLDDAFYLVLEKLNDLWRRAQRPRTTPGGPSSPGRGDGDADMIGEFYHGESADDGDDE